MKHIYSKQLLLITTLFIFTLGISQNDAVVYQADPTPGLLSGSVFSGGDFGLDAYAGDGIVLAGTERIITRIGVSIFQRNMAEFSGTQVLTVRLYTDCPVTGEGGAAGMCGADGAGSFIEGSEKTLSIFIEPASGEFVYFDMENLDISSETDDTIWVMINSTSFDLLGVVNGDPTLPGGVGAQPAGEPPTSFITRCSTADNSSGCAESASTVGINSFALIVNATEALDVNESNLDQAISIYPNPVQDNATIAFQDFINPTQAKIFDINGKQVSQKFTYNLENNFKMDMSELSSGTYFLHFESEEGTVVKQLIKI